MEYFYCICLYSDLSCNYDSKGPDSSSCWVPSAPVDGTPQRQAACGDANQQEKATFPSVLQTVLETALNQ